MGLFGRIFKRRQKEEELPDLPYIIEPLDEEIQEPKKSKVTYKASSKMESISLIQENCEQIIECKRQIAEAKVEYQAVTSYLTDMQKIDMIPLEEREEIDDAARKIVNLLQERKKLRQKSSEISDAQFRLFEQYEKQLSKDLNRIKESEEYQAAIENDINQLENEKLSIIDDEKTVMEKQSFLKAIAIVSIIIIIALFLLFAVLTKSTGADLSLPFFLTVIMGVGLAMYIYLESQRNQAELKYIRKKANKVVLLLNKVKIKSVNNQNYLDYTFNKYMVENFGQLQKRWTEYIRLKEEMKRYQNNTELLNFYNTTLQKELKKFGVADAEIWIYQPDAIIDKKEMVEVRHRLNVRRQKLRERIDLHNTQRENAIDQITEIVKKNPVISDEAYKIMKQFNIDE